VIVRARFVLLEMFAYFRSPLGWRTLAKRTIAEVVDDNCAGLAAQLAFYFLLSVFPALLFLVALISYLPVDAALDTTLQQWRAFLPGDVVRIVQDQLREVAAGSSGGLLTLGIVGAIWSSSSAMTAIIDALNRAYDIEEWRPWWRRRVIAIALTIALALFAVMAFALVVGGADLAAWLAERAGLGRAFELTWRILQWPVAAGLVVLAVDLVYRFAPNAEAKWVWLTPGALVATLLWLVVSVGFRIYVQNFGDYSAVYGAIGSVIVLMLWLYLSGFALLVGAELNSEIDRALPTRDDRPQGPHQRKRIGPAAENAEQFCADENDHGQ
jgi:membrane protein